MKSRKVGNHYERHFGQITTRRARFGNRGGKAWNYNSPEFLSLVTGAATGNGLRRNTQRAMAKPIALKPT